VSDGELESLSADFGGLFKIPDNFCTTVSAYSPSSSGGGPHHHGQQQQHRVAVPQIKINPQTTLLCDMLGITDPFAVFSGRQPFNGGAMHVDHQPAPGGLEDDDTNDSLDVDDRDEGILDDSDFVDTTFDSSASSSFAGVASSANRTFNPDEISLDDDDDDSPRAAGGDAAVVEPPVKRLSLSPRCGSGESSMRDGDGACAGGGVEPESSYEPENGQPSEGPRLDDERSTLGGDVLPTGVSSATASAPDVGEGQSTIDDRPPAMVGGLNRLKRRNMAIYANKDNESSDES
jgi:hypothetical protein